jgi:hypothetical protein
MRLFPTPARAEATAVGRQLAVLLRDGAAALAPTVAALTPSAADALVTQACAHSVAPLLRRRLLQQRLFAALPEPARARLDAVYVDSAARAMARYRELERLLERFADANVAAVALKGIYLAKAVYAEPALRPMADIDLLVRVDDLEQAQSLLFAQGYARPDSERPVGDYVGSSIHLPGFERAGGHRIEVHMAIESPDAPFAIDLDGIWRRVRPWSVEGRALLALSAEDLLLHLCLHGMYHHRFRIGLIALTDIDQVIRRETPDWKVLAHRARTWGAQTPVFLGLMLASRLIGAPVPAEVLAALAPEGRTEEALGLAEQTLLHERPTNRQADRLRALHGQKLAFNYLGKVETLRGLPGSRAKLRYLVANAFPDRDGLAYQYPRWAGSRWIWLLYLVHWAVLGGRVLRAMRLEAWRQGAVMRKLDRRWFG